MTGTLNSTPPNRCQSWQALQAHARKLQPAHLRELCLLPDRSELAREAAGLRLDYSRQRLDGVAVQLLLRLAEERGWSRWRDALFSGERINTTENRAVLHPALRGGAAAPQAVREALERCSTLAERIRSGAWQCTGAQPVERVVHLGTGGSDLGPRLVVDALAELRDRPIEYRFASNVDPIDLERALAGARPESTLFVVVSKTFTTQETMENAHAARRWLAAALPGKSLEGHFIAVSENEAQARRFGAAEVLPMWDWVGGRYSVWSAVGFTAMCAIGPQAFEHFLQGAAEMDRHFVDAPAERNVPLLLGLLGVWNINFLGFTAHAVLPYSTALRLLPAYLQQLEMESNGKQVDREGNAVGYATAPVIWGAEGTVGQHSFHQLLHQGTHIIPADFIVARDAPGDAKRRQILAAHAEAQAQALAFGRDDASLPPWKRYPGNRPSSTLHLDALDARNLGRLLALYEHKVFVQGVIWNINSFDQWGVELGKQLAGEILKRGAN